MCKHRVLSCVSTEFIDLVNSGQLMFILFTLCDELHSAHMSISVFMKLHCYH